MAIDVTAFDSDVSGTPRDSDVKLRKYTREEVLAHNTPEDCWLVIDRKVYDVSKWVPNHPGGSLIYVRAGDDCTYMFNSYHPLYVWKLLSQYCIGEIVDSPSDSRLELHHVEFAGSVNEPFYVTLKQRVEQHFRKNKIDGRVHPQLYIKTIVLLTAYWFVYYMTFYRSHTPTVTTIFAVALGFLISQIAMSITHDGNHGSYSDYPGLCFLMGMALDLIGSSSFMWKQHHVGAHHPFTNINLYDTDIKTNEVDGRRVHRDHRWLPVHKFQYIYLWPIYSFVVLKAVWLEDFQILMCGHIGKLRITKMTSKEAKQFWSAKIFYFVYMVVLPLVFGVHSWSTYWKIYLLAQVIASWGLVIFFEVSHLVKEASFPPLEIRNGIPTVPHGWAAMQCYASVNFHTNSLLMTHLCGGLNLQIEHHLFPGVCHVHYFTIQPIVEATCKEFNIPYKRHASLLSAIKSHFQFLKSMGVEKLLELRLG